MGFAFQFYALYPHLKVEDNIGFPLESMGLNRQERRQRVADIVERLGLGALVGRYPRQLSGGDQQRVALARAMVRRPQIYLMDEPLGTLDAGLRLEMREMIRAQQLDAGIATLYVTHDQEEAMSLADQVTQPSLNLLRRVPLCLLALFSLSCSACLSPFSLARKIGRCRLRQQASL